MLKLQAQQITYDHQFLTTKDGLAANEVLCGLQDQQGFLWFGTRHGLNRYDGNKFTLVSKKDGLQSNRIVRMAEDKEGLLWLQYGYYRGKRDTDGRIDIYDPATSEVVPYEQKIKNLPFEAHFPSTLLGDRTNGIYIIDREKTVYGLTADDAFILVPQATSKLREMVKTDWIPNKYSLTMQGDHITDGGMSRPRLSHFNSRGNIEHIPMPAENNRSEIRIDEFIENGAVQTKYKKVDSATYAIIKKRSKLFRTTESWTDPFSPSILLRFKDQLYIFDDYQTTLLLELENKSRYALDNIFYFTDRQNNSWVCSFQGLHKFTPRKQKFNLLFDRKSYPNQLRLAYSVRAIAADLNGNVWSGGNGGLRYHSTDKDSYSKIPIPMNTFHTIMREGHIDLLGYKIFEFDLSAGNFGAINPVIIKNEFPKPLGQIWAGMHVGNNQYLLGGISKKQYVWDAENEQILPIQFCEDTLPDIGVTYRFIYNDEKDQYIAVGDLGIYIISKDLCITDYYGSSSFADDNHKIPFTNFRDIHEDEDGFLWISTLHDGLLRWKMESNEITNITVDDGLPSNSTYCILGDDFGHLWISSDNGLIRFNRDNFEINIYTIDDGISENEFNTLSKFQRSDGRMYFGGMNGITSFHPKDFDRDTFYQNIPLKITSYQQFIGREDKVINLTFDLIKRKEIILNPGDRFFRLEFALLDFRKSAKRYKYQIQGFEDQWNFTDEGSLQVSGLPYGKYDLNIASLSHSGGWSAKQLSIPIQVLRPFYITIWAFLLYGLAFAGFLYLFRRYQVQKAIEKSDKLRLEELNEVKTKMYTNITHEFRTPLTVIMGMANQIEDDISNASQKLNGEPKSSWQEKIKNRSGFILRNANNLLQLINQMLDLSKLDNAQLKVFWELGDVAVFLNYLSESFHSFAETAEVQLIYYSEVDELEMDFDRNKIQQIVSNLLSNAIKFTPKNGEVVFHVSQVPAGMALPEKALKIRISNSGAGIPEAHQAHLFDRFYQVHDEATRNTGGTGIGLALTKELTELMGGTIAVSSSSGQGTAFTVVLPIHKNAQQGASLEPIAQQVSANAQSGSALSNEMIPTIESPDTPLILIIEDNADVAAYIRLCLQDQYQIMWAENGQKGILLALEQVPDIIISDVMMPEKDGYEVTDHLKNDERSSHIPIILLTAKADVDSKLTGLRRGADAYLTKPFDKKELLIRIENLIKLRQRMQSKLAQDRSKENGASIPVQQDEYKMENTFLAKVHAIFEIELSNSSYEVPKLSQALSMSQSQVYRKLKALTGKSIVAYLRSYRLNKGKKLLQSTDQNISQVAYEVGFTDPSYFSKMFSEEFGHLPKEVSK